MFEDLKFYIFLKIKNTPKSYTGRIISGSVGNLLQLDRICSSIPKDEEDAFCYSQISQIRCTANDGKDYSFHNLKWYGTQTSFGNENAVFSVTLTFESLIENPTHDYSYNGIIFSFDHIEKIFGRTSFDTQFPNDENRNEIKLTLTVPEQLSVTLDDGIQICIFSDFDGLVSSYTLFDLNVKQKKRVHVTFPSRQDYGEICRFICELKLYFEFVYNCILSFDELTLIDESDSYQTSEIIVSKLCSKSSEGTELFTSRYNGTPDELTQGIKLWYTLYSKYSESILIWKKTIYNRNVDRSDKFLWLCQSFESLCQNDQEVYSKALTNAKTKNPKISYPNLSDYLLVVEEIIGFQFTNRTKYYQNTVRVRDKLTHNNPEKAVTEIEKDECFRLIEYFHLAYMVSKLGGLSIARMISLP